MFSKLQASNTLVFLWKMKVFKAPSFKNIDFPFENWGFQSSKFQKHRFSFGKCKFCKLPASKTSVFLWKMQVFRSPSFTTHMFSFGKWRFSLLDRRTEPNGPRAAPDRPGWPGWLSWLGPAGPSWAGRAGTPSKLFKKNDENMVLLQNQRERVFFLLFFETVKGVKG